MYCFCIFYYRLFILQYAYPSEYDVFGGNNLNYKRILTAGSVLALGFGLLAGTSKSTFAADATSDQTIKTEKTPTQITTSYNLMTKVAGSKNYTIWKKVDDGKVSGKVADAINFRYSHLQSNQSIKTGKYTYWMIYVDGRRVGWVNQNFFARNKISVAPNVSLVNNPISLFDTKDAINYATDDTGTVVDNEDVKVSKQYIDTTNSNTYNIKYTYGSGQATSKVYVRKTASEGIADADSVTAKPGTNSLASWSSHYGSSINYVSPSEYTTETKTHKWSNNGLTLSTRLYQPVLLSVKTDSSVEGDINRVGHIPEGLTVSNGWAYTSLLSHTDLLNGHIVGYNLNNLVSPYNPQYLLTMSQSKFNTYAKNFKVSPYLPIGHGQALGSTKNYIYALVNDNTDEGTGNSEELVQIRKSNMEMSKIWTIKCWNGSEKSPRYFRNAVITDDHTMYATCYDRTTDRYEYYKFTRTGDNWNPEILGATKSTFVKNAPVQGFTYDTKNKNFYLAFNDLIVKIAQNGTIKAHYSYKTGREIEGISVSDNRLYVNLAQRAELLQSNKLTK